MSGAEYDCAVIVPITRGIFRVTAASIGLLLALGIVHAMNAMTVPIPMFTASERELAVMTVFMLPWTLLFCSGFEDFAVAARRDWVFWSGTILVLIFVYYSDRHVASFTLTRVAMPLLATAGGALPHVIRRLRVLYTLCSLFAGAIGLFFGYQFSAALVLHGSAIGMIARLMVFFCVASIATGVFGVFSLTDAIRR